MPSLKKGTIVRLKRDIPSRKANRDGDWEPITIPAGSLGYVQGGAGNAVTVTDARICPNCSGE